MAFEQFGRYRLEGLIGVGGMGEVHRAVDVDKDRVVALKRLTAGLASDAEYRARFRREAQLVARLTVPHIIPIHDYGEIDGRLFLDMPLIRGVDGAKLLGSGNALPPSRALEIVTQAAEALDAAHGAGLVHRDVKPSNLLITGTSRDFVYLIDFGLVHDLAATAVTASGPAGTLAYMAPERFDGHGDHRVDVYSLTCVLHELLTGTRPYRRESVPAIIHAHLHAPAPRPSAVRPELSPMFDAVVACGLAKDPQQRFASAGDLAAAARNALRAAERSPTLATVPAAPLLAPVMADAATAPVGGRPPPTVRAAAAVRPGVVSPSVPAPAPARSGRYRRWRLALFAVLTAIALGAGTLLALPTLRTGAETGPASPAAPETPPGTSLAEVFTAPRPVTTIPLEAGAVEVSPDGALAYVVGRSDVEVLDATTYASIATVPTESEVNAIAISPDGRFVYTANYDPLGVSVIDTSTRAVVATLPTPEIVSLVVSADGNALYATTLTAGTVLVIDTTTRRVRSEIPTGAILRDIVLSPDGRFGYVSVTAADFVAVIDLTTETVTTRIPVGDTPTTLALTSDGTRLYASNSDPPAVSVIDTAGRTVVTTVRTPGVPADLIVARGDRWVYIADSSTGSASVLDATTNTLTASVPFGSSPAALTLHPNGRRVFAVNGDEPTISVLDIFS